MKKVLQLITLILILVGGFFVFQYLLPQLRPPQGFLKVESIPTAEVFLDGKLIGKTPLQEKNLKVGDYNLVLKANIPTLPKNSDNQENTKVVELKQKIDLQGSAVTVVRYEFAPNGAFSSGEILGLRKGAGISVVTSPENAEISLDGKSLGESPLSQVIEPGVRTLRVSKEGYLSREIGINIEKGFRLTAWVSLALNPYPQAEKLLTKGGFTLFDLSTNNLTLSGNLQSWAEAIWHFQITQKSIPQRFDLLIDGEGKTYTLDKDWEKKKEVTVGYLSGSAGKLSDKAKKEWGRITKGSSKKKTSSEVKILETPNGFLNVRSGPGTNHSIIQKVNPGQTFTLVSEEKDWYKILLNASKSGWIFSQYAKKL